MVIALLNKTTCAVCGKVISEGDDHLGFPAFLKKNHKLWKYSDAAFHTQCFENWKHHKEFTSIFSQIYEVDANKPKIPEGMSFNDFEKTDAYKTYLAEQDKIYSRATNKT